MDARRTNRPPRRVAKCCEPRKNRSDRSGRSWLHGKLFSQGTPCGVGASVPEQLAPHRSSRSSLHQQPAVILLSSYYLYLSNVGIAIIDHPPNHHKWVGFQPSKMDGLWHCYTHITGIPWSNQGTVGVNLAILDEGCSTQEAIQGSSMLLTPLGQGLPEQCAPCWMKHSMGWLKGKSTGNHRFSHQKNWMFL